MKSSNRRARELTYQTFTFWIEDWIPSYSFALGHGRQRDGTYRDHVDITLLARCLAPKKFADRTGNLMFLGNRELMQALDESPRNSASPMNVGVMTIRGDQTEFLGALPRDALWAMIPALSAGEFKVVQLHGRALHRGKAETTSIHFFREIDEEDF